jgi:hypothetical protein
MAGCLMKLDGAGEFSHFGFDQRQSVEPALLLRIIAKLSPQLLLDLRQTGLRFSKRHEVGPVGREKVTPLAGLGVLNRAEQLSQHLPDLKRMGGQALGTGGGPCRPQEEKTGGNGNR